MLENFPLIEALVADLQFEDRLTGDEAVRRVHREYTSLGPYSTAKRYDLLINGSAEEFAMEWMSFYNEYAGYKVY